MLIFAPGGCAAAEDAVTAVVGGNVQVAACSRNLHHEEEYLNKLPLRR